MKKATENHAYTTVSIAVITLIFSAINCIGFIYIFMDFADRNARIPAYVGAGRFPVFFISLIILGITLLFLWSRQKIYRLFRVLSVAGILLFTLCVYDTASILCFAGFSSIGDNLEITTAKSGDISETIQSFDGIYYIGLLNDRNLYEIHDNLSTIAIEHNIGFQTTVIDNDIADLSKKLKHTFSELEIDSLPVILFIENGNVVGKYESITAFTKALQGVAT